MALIHHVSDAINMRIEKDGQGWPVIEIEFKFVRYRLVIDDQVKGQKLKDLIDTVLNPASRTKTEKQGLPQFYKDVEKK